MEVSMTWVWTAKKIFRYEPYFPKLSTNTLKVWIPTEVFKRLKMTRATSHHTCAVAVTRERSKSSPGRFSFACTTQVAVASAAPTRPTRVKRRNCSESEIDFDIWKGEASTTMCIPFLRWLVWCRSQAMESTFCRILESILNSLFRIDSRSKWGPTWSFTYHKSSLITCVAILTKHKIPKSRISFFRLAKWTFSSRIRCGLIWKLVSSTNTIKSKSTKFSCWLPKSKTRSKWTPKKSCTSPIQSLWLSSLTNATCRNFLTMKCSKTRKKEK